MIGQNGPGAKKMGYLQIMIKIVSPSKNGPGVKKMGHLQIIAHRKMGLGRREWAFSNSWYNHAGGENWSPIVFPQILCWAPPKSRRRRRYDAGLPEMRDLRPLLPPLRSQIHLFHLRYVLVIPLFLIVFFLLDCLVGFAFCDELWVVAIVEQITELIAPAMTRPLPQRVRGILFVKVLVGDHRSGNKISSFFRLSVPHLVVCVIVIFFVLMY